MDDEENQGSMVLGLALGFFLPCCLGVLISFVMQGQKTLTGSIIGSIVQVLMWTCASVALTIVNSMFLQG